MAYGFQIKAGDLLPILTVSATDGNNQPVTLTNVQSVLFKMWLQGTTAAAFTVNAAGSYAAAGDGTARLSYTWQSGDTAVAGAYWAEFEVTFTNGKIESFPTPGWFAVLIDADR